MPKGGYRKNAGRPKGSKDMKTLEKKWFREQFMARMKTEWDSVIDAQIELAKGIAIIDKKDDTGERIFDRPPDSSAGKNLIEQTMGKASDSLDLTSDGKPLKIQIFRFKEDES